MNSNPGNPDEPISLPSINPNPNPFQYLTGGTPTSEELTMRAVMESCPAKCVMSTGMGFGMGLLFGMFMSSTSDTNLTPAFQAMSTKHQIKSTLKEMWAKSYSTGKSFALVGSVFATSECIIETYRGKNDLFNGSSAGCVSGAILAAKSGPQAMAFGCAGFAAFSTAIDYYMRYTD